jgi:glycosyltransferase involved in cell wall biosynthesis
MALRYISPGGSVLDIGCHQGELFKTLGKKLRSGEGMDPLLQEDVSGERFSLTRGTFPGDWKGTGSFDYICLLAVLEHIPLSLQQGIAVKCGELLSREGLVIITAPSPRADVVLDALKKLHLIKGMSLEDHYGFDPGQIPAVFGQAGFRLLAHKKFQLGFNNLYVLQKGRETGGGTEVVSLSFILPCLNEEQTLPACLSKIKTFIAQLQIPAEIIVADNGSTDHSLAICREAGVKYIQVATKGYGSALHHGILHATGSHVIFADADDSYDLREAGVFLDAFEKGFDVVIGNRYKGGIMKDAMPLLHRWIGTPIISFIGRRSFHVPIGDFNCGMRGIKRSTYDTLEMKSGGMEFATELIAKASYKRCSITEVPVRLYKDGRGRKPHLKTWSDGWKHLKLILLLSPKWLLLYPALFFSIIGLILGSIIVSGQIEVFNVHLDIHTLYFCSIFLILALTFIQFYCIVNLYRRSVGLYMEQRGITLWVSRHLNFEKGLLIGLALFLTGVIVNATALYQWYLVSFRELNPGTIFRIIIPGGFCMIAGLQLVVFSFFVTMIKSNN